MKKVLVWETSSSVAGGQKMTLTVMDLLKEDCDFFCLIPGEGKLAEELRKRNIPYRLMGDQSLPAGIKGKRVYFRYAWLSAKNILRSLGEIRRYGADVLYAPGPASLPWSAVCGALTGKPVIWHLHHLFMDGPTKKLLNLTSRWKAVRDIISVSQVVGDQITNRPGHEKVTCVYNPVDTRRYEGGDAQKVLADAEAALGRPVGGEKAPVLVQTAVLRKMKRQDLFLQVIQALQQKGIPAAGILVGEAITEDDRAFKAELLQRIEAGKLEQSIYLAGYRENVQDYLAAADFVFVPSDVEGLSLAAQEAMCAKRRLLATETGGVGELLRVADCGYLYPKDAAPEQIADIVIGAMGCDSSARIENGYAFCRDHSPEAYRSSLREIFSRGKKG